MVVYGNDADKETLRERLARTLNARLVENIRVNSPIFDNTHVLAEMAHKYMDTVLFEFGQKGAWGCQWRSGLYRGNGTDEL